MLYRFVDSQLACGFPVGPTCQVVGVSTSAYYDWSKRKDQTTPTQAAEGRLVAEIRSIHARSDGTYGEPRVTAELRRRGWAVNHKRVARLMHRHGIRGHTPPRKRTTTIADRAHRIPDLVQGSFDLEAPDTAWASDITYIRTWEGFLYLAGVEDLASRRILGLSMADHLRAELVADALSEAVGTRGGQVPGVVFHSDRGTQYTSDALARLCEAEGIRQSVGRTGVCWDNAPIESFFATLKKELVNRRTFRTRAEARLAIRRWVEA